MDAVDAVRPGGLKQAERPQGRVERRQPPGAGCTGARSIRAGALH
jgi:hypothetical protein